METLVQVEGHTQAAFLYTDRRDNQFVIYFMKDDHPGVGVGIPVQDGVDLLYVSRDPVDGFRAYEVPRVSPTALTTENMEEMIQKTLLDISDTMQTSGELLLDEGLSEYDPRTSLDDKHKQQRAEWMRGCAVGNRAAAEMQRHAQGHPSAAYVEDSTTPHYPAHHARHAGHTGHTDHAGHTEHAGHAHRNSPSLDPYAEATHTVGGGGPCHKCGGYVEASSSTMKEKYKTMKKKTAALSARAQAAIHARTAPKAVPVAARVQAAIYASTAPKAVPAAARVPAAIHASTASGSPPAPKTKPKTPTIQKDPVKKDANNTSSDVEEKVDSAGAPDVTAAACGMGTRPCYDYRPYSYRDCSSRDPDYRASCRKYDYDERDCRARYAPCPQPGPEYGVPCAPCPPCPQPGPEYRVPCAPCAPCPPCPQPGPEYREPCAPCPPCPQPGARGGAMYQPCAPRAPGLPWCEYSARPYQDSAYYPQQEYTYSGACY